jgi:hypothetical protein
MAQDDRRILDCMSRINDAQLDFRHLKEVPFRNHAQFANFVIAQEIVRKYIQDRECILYGGIAIDYALRLRGDSIYEDDELPDYDFFVPDNVAAARELISILSARIANVRIYGSRAIYPRTIKIAVGVNNWVADITYLPRALFSRIPTLTFDGLKFVHPHFQFSDLHSSLAYPYEGAPREAVFARWEKDIARFNKLYIAYPIEITIAHHQPIETTRASVSRDFIAHTILQGFAAYSLYYNLIRDRLDDDELREIIPAMPPEMSENDCVFNTPRAIIEVFAHRDKIRTAKSASQMREFRAFLDLTDRLTVMPQKDATIFAYSSFSRYAAYQSFDHATRGTTGPRKLRAVSIHGLLKYFIALYVRIHYFESIEPFNNGIDSRIYLRYYASCLALIRASRRMGRDRAFFDPSLVTYGEMSPTPSDLLSMYVDISRVEIDEKKIEMPPLVVLPRNLRATDENGATASFNYDECPFTRFSGEEILH